MDPVWGGHYESLVGMCTFIYLVLSHTVIAKDSDSIKVAIGNIYRDQDATSKYGIQVENDLQAIYSGAGLNAGYPIYPMKGQFSP